MTAKEKYKTAAAFRRAIQDKLKETESREGINIQTLYLHTAGAQLLSRLFKSNDVPWSLKGGHALELRLQKSRKTKDIDLTLRDNKIFDGLGKNKNTALRDLLISKLSIDIGDYFKFTISESIASLAGTPYGGAKFKIEARVDKKIFARFDLDIGIGDVWIEPSKFKLKNYLEGSGLNPGEVDVIPIEQHLSEKNSCFNSPESQ